MTERHPVIRQLYVSGALLAFAASFAPLWSVEEPDEVYDTMNLWTAVAVDQGGAAPLGIMLILALVATAVVAGSRPEHGFGAPSTVLGIGAVALLLLVLKPGTGADDVSFGPGGGLMFGTTLALMAAALADVLMKPRAGGRGAAAEARGSGLETR